MLDKWDDQVTLESQFTSITSNDSQFDSYAILDI